MILASTNTHGHEYLITHPRRVNERVKQQPVYFIRG